MVERVLTETMRKRFRTQFVEFPKENSPETRDDLHRVAAALLQPLVAIDRLRLAYMQRMSHAMRTRNTIGGIAAVVALQKDMQRAADPTTQGRHVFHNEYFKTIAGRAAHVATKGTLRQLLDEYGGSSFMSIRGRDLDIFLAEELVKLDAEIEAEKALEAAAATEEPSAAPPVGP